MIPQRVRPCNRPVLKKPDGESSAYCINHAYIDSPEINYVTCPFEPKNRMPEHLLENHLKACPKAKMIQDQESQPFHTKGINYINPNSTTLQ